MLRVFIDTGARLAEVANLTIPDIDLDAQTLMVNGRAVASGSSLSEPRP
jgi:integrase